jgi:hypothetical protein
VHCIPAAVWERNGGIKKRSEGEGGGGEERERRTGFAESVSDPSWNRQSVHTSHLVPFSSEFPPSSFTHTTPAHRLLLRGKSVQNWQGREAEGQAREENLTRLGLADGHLGQDSEEHKPPCDTMPCPVNTESCSKGIGGGEGAKDWSKDWSASMPACKTARRCWCPSTAQVPTTKSSPAARLPPTRVCWVLLYA